MLVAAWVVMNVMPWGGIAMSQRNFIAFAGELGSDADYLIVGDSKAGPFSTDCVIPWLQPYRGVVSTADSVTPVYQWYNMREIRARFPEFRPKTVFIFVGANNMNENGLHARRDFTFFNQVSLPDAWTLSSARGDGLLFTEVLLSRLFPVYGYRVQITHLHFGERRGRICPSASESALTQKGPFEFEAVTRNPVNDRNYFDIYRRSAYNDYESSVAVAGALEKMVEIVRGFDAVPILILPPVASEMWELEQEMVGAKFDDTMAEIVERTGVEMLDLRDVTRFEFQDVNHLSDRGAYDMAREYFEPILRRTLEP
jgi:hypothetical protein